MLRQKLSTAVRRKSNLTFTHITAHQDNLHVLMSAMQWTSSECLSQQYHNKTVTALNCLPAPVYAANLVFELHSSSSNSSTVKIAHNGEYIYPCGRFQYDCPLEEFFTKAKELETTFEE